MAHKQNHTALAVRHLGRDWAIHVKLFGEVLVVSITVGYSVHLNSVLIRSCFTVRENGELGRDWSSTSVKGWDLKT